MKNLFTLLIFVFFAFSLNAQYIYNDFDANQNEEFTGWPNAPVVIANPDPTGINTSANVGEWVRSEEQWAHVYTELDGYVNFETGTAFTMKVWSPKACEVLFKLEDKTNGGVFVEVMGNVTTANAWEELTFDFTGAASGTYDKIVIFFDFAVAEDNTFYFDDIEGPEYGAGAGPKPLLEANVQDNFENDGWSTIPAWFFQDPDLVDLTVVTDPVEPTNNVAEYNRSGAFEWTNAQFVLDWRMDLSSRHVFTVDVYLPSTNDYTGDLTPTAALKLQNSLLGGNAWTTQTEIKHTVETYDEWVTVEFDFGAVADSVNYDQMVVQFGGEGHFTAGMFYFDNFKLTGGVGINESKILDVNVFPNPVVSELQLQNVTDVVSVQIYTISGQLVSSVNPQSNKLDVSNLLNGLYFIRVEDTSNSVYIGKFMKQ